MPPVKAFISPSISSLAFLSASLVADNTGPDIDLSYLNGEGAIILTFSSEVDLGTYDFTWKVNVGTADSNVSTVEIVIYDSLA